MAQVHLRDVVKKYGPLEVVHSINLDIADGEFVVLVGPSGCGKSTTLRMVAGLEGISGGEVQIGGRVVNDLPPRERNISMVFQNYALYPHMTVRENLGFSLKIAKQSQTEIDKAVDEAAEILSLTPLLDRKPGALSGGQRQRVAMGRAIVRHPEVFLFDEPLSNLDAKLRVDMRTEIKRMHQTFGSTIVYVTHDQIEAMTLGTRIAVLKDGIVQQYGTPAEIYNDPSNMFVADFMGSPAMNLIPATVRGHEIEMSRAGDDPLVLSFDALPVTVSARNGQDVIVGIRPEAITDAAGRGGEKSIQATCRIDVVEPAGADIYAITTLGGKEVVTRLHQDWSGSANQAADLLFNLEKIVFFDPQSGERLR